MIVSFPAFDPTMGQALIVFTNLPDTATAQALARQLVEHRVAACVQIGSRMQSTYRWCGTLEQTEEVSLQIKTTQARYGEVEAAIRTAHPYQVPEIVAVPIVAGLPAYLDWIVAETKKDIDV